MKRILPAISVALLACVPQGAGAIESDMMLDQFPSSRPASTDRIDTARRGGRTAYGTTARAVGRYETSFAARQGSGRYRTHGSFIEVSALGGAVEPGTVYGTAGTANSPGVIVINSGADLGSLTAAIDGALRGGAKILNIETDRLDRRPYGANGLDVVHAGGAKIIRISPDFRRADARAAMDEAPAPIVEAKADVPQVAVYPDTDMAERPVDPPAPRQYAPPVAEPQVATAAQSPAERVTELQVPPVPTPSPAPAPVEAPAAAATPAAPAATAAYLEPWTPDWLRDCVARHPNFDASLGTYVNDSGQRRFCTGEP